MNLIEPEIPKHNDGTNRNLSVEQFSAQIASRAAGERIIVAIAGPPGSGKSTLTAALVIALAERHGVKAQVIPMDGFHYDNAILQQLALTTKKGAPETFDVGGLEATLKRLLASDRLEYIAVPVFDRDRDFSRASAQLIDIQTKVLLVEGNYLLMENLPWSSLKQYFDLTAMILSDEATLRARLTKRWLDLNLSEAEATSKVETNDIPNARRVIKESLRADFNLI
jgi:pantothenate kinase